MNKIKKLDYLRTEIMVALSEIKMLTDKISDEEEIGTTQIMGSIAHRIAKRAAILNEKIGIIFRLWILKMAQIDPSKDLVSISLENNKIIIEKAPFEKE